MPSQRARDTGIAKGDGFYSAECTCATELPQYKIDLWRVDHLHAGKYGSYLSTVVIFCKLTGINPASFGANEKAAADRGISPGDAVKLQQVAWDQLVAEGMPLTPRFPACMPTLMQRARVLAARVRWFVGATVVVDGLARAVHSASNRPGCFVKDTAPERNRLQRLDRFQPCAGY